MFRVRTAPWAAVRVREAAGLEHVELALVRPRARAAAPRREELEVENHTAGGCSACRRAPSEAVPRIRAPRAARTRRRIEVDALLGTAGWPPRHAVQRPPAAGRGAATERQRVAPRPNARQPPGNMGAGVPQSAAAKPRGRDVLPRAARARPRPPLPGRRPAAALEAAWKGARIGARARCLPRGPAFWRAVSPAHLLDRPRRDAEPSPRPTTCDFSQPCTFVQKAKQPHNGANSPPLPMIIVWSTAGSPHHRR